MSAAPVGNHSPVEAPFLLEYPVQNPVVMAEVLALKQVVCTHDRPCSAFLNCHLEGRKIYFIQGPVIHDCIVCVSVCFLIVQREMLHAHRDSVLLYLLNIRHGHLSGQIRVLAHIFEVAAAKRGAVDVHTRTEKHVLLTVARLLSDRLSVES